jgi:KEOPS complex subunit Cgi121
MKIVEGRAEIEELDDFLASIGDLEAKFDCAIQVFDADYVLGRDHLRTAVEHADRAFDRGENVARERAVEILLYAAGRRQINRALQMGVSEGESDVVVVVHNPEGDELAEKNAAKAVRNLLGDASVSADTSTDTPASADAPGTASTDAPESASVSASASVPTNALAADRIDREAVREFFDVSEAELAASDANLADLVCERVALLDVKK